MTWWMMSNAIANAEHTIFQLIDAQVGQQAAVLRSTYLVS